MPFNGSNVYTPPAADFPVVTQTVISSTHFNNTINDIASALSDCVTRDGQGALTANMQGGGFRVTNIGITAFNGAVGTPSVNVGDGATGLYRSALNELAVSVNGVQRGRFDATGLIVTGLVTLTTTLTAPTSVVTPLVVAASGAVFQFGSNGIARWQQSFSGVQRLEPINDNSDNLGSATNRVAGVFTPTIDSGTTGSLSLRTNNGTTGLILNDVTSADTPINVFAGRTGISSARITTGGNNLQFECTGANQHIFKTGGGTQLQILDTASASRNITVTGSNGGNPTLGVTGGSLAITPSVVIAGNLLQIGVNPSSTAPGIGLPSAAFITTRNAANSGDIALIQGGAINSVNDIVVVGGVAGVGVVGRSRSGAGAPAVADVPSGCWAVWRDTAGATTKLYYNNAGTLQSVALA